MDIMSQGQRQFYQTSTQEYSLADLWPARAWFLIIASVCEYLCVCACVCPPAPEAIDN